MYIYNDIFMHTYVLLRIHKYYIFILNYHNVISLYILWIIRF